MFLVSLVTRGSPDALTGGHLYHRRMADAAAEHCAEIEFVSSTLLHDPFRAAGGVVVIDSLAAWSVAPWVLAGFGRGPIAAIVHQPPGGIDHGAIRSRLQRRVDRAVYGRCALIIVPSASLAEELTARSNLDRERVRVIEPGCDPPATPPPVHALRDGRRIAVLSVANWLPNKGTLELLEAVAGLADECVTLHLAGRDDVDASYSTRVRDRLGDPALKDRVVVHGPVPPGEIGALYAASDVFALLSRSETYGMVYGEALAAGLPIVAWRSGNVTRLIEDGREGRLVDPDDVIGVSAALQRLATDGDWRAELSTRARARGQRLPTWDRAAESFFDALRSLAAHG